MSNQSASEWKDNWCFSSIPKSPTLDLKVRLPLHVFKT